jgi:hypothetical protein
VAIVICIFIERFVGTVLCLPTASGNGTMTWKLK